MELGALVASGTQAFSLADVHLVKAVFGIPDTLLSSVRLGADQVVTTESIPQEFKGRITAITPQADQKSRSFQVEVTIPNPKSLLISGMVASLVLREGKLPTPALVVPLNAIISSGGNANQFSAFVVTHEGDKDVVRRHAVQPGSAYGDRVAITTGLQLGDRVVTNGAALVTEGQAVRIMP